jgi:hypothetical protein
MARAYAVPAASSNLGSGQPVTKGSSLHRQTRLLHAAPCKFCMFYAHRSRGYYYCIIEHPNRDGRTKKMAPLQRKICEEIFPNFLGVTETRVRPVAAGARSQVRRCQAHYYAIATRAKGQARGSVCVSSHPHDQDPAVNCKVLRSPQATVLAEESLLWTVAENSGACALRLTALPLFERSQCLLYKLRCPGKHTIFLIITVH